ncbi:ORF138 [Spodoptera frugiperda granulovirus]|uniref:ORF138 n=1 Tax=Spodoptera frugiperda granulovirus TaxID=307454 RepID=A0A0C5AS88_9BBAC|nr:ORF138 [Spodoptera frugiperda granulovirus]AJK91799.1 ORF138 [Spodoptera frugiperda granulovirus]AXS01163.1 ORF143 [Spodoptera frugiperda granulovirus]
MASHTSLIFNYNVFLINSSDKIFLDGYKYVGENTPGQYIHQNLSTKELFTLPFRKPEINQPITQIYF